MSFDVQRINATTGTLSVHRSVRFGGETVLWEEKVSSSLSDLNLLTYCISTSIIVVDFVFLSFVIDFLLRVAIGISSGVRPTHGFKDLMYLNLCGFVKTVKRICVELL